MPEKGEIIRREVLTLPHGPVEILFYGEDAPATPVFDECSDNATYEEIVEFRNNGGEVR